MRIDRVREAELKQRKGSSIKMIIQLIWFGISCVIAYFLSSYIFNNTELTIEFLRTSFLVPAGISNAAVPDWAIHAVFAFVLVLIMQFIFAIGYAFGSPEGRKKTGQPRADSRNPDPFDDERPY